MIWLADGKQTQFSVLRILPARMAAPSTTPNKIATSQGSASLQHIKKRRFFEMASKLVKSALGRVLAATGAFRNKIGKQDTIVAFHRVNDFLPEGDSLTCSSEMFRTFCTFFKEHYDVV